MNSDSIINDIICHMQLLYRAHKLSLDKDQCPDDICSMLRLNFALTRQLQVSIVKWLPLPKD